MNSSAGYRDCLAGGVDAVLAVCTDNGYDPAPGGGACRRTHRRVPGSAGAGNLPWSTPRSTPELTPRGISGAGHLHGSRYDRGAPHHHSRQMLAFTRCGSAQAKETRPTQNHHLARKIDTRAHELPAATSDSSLLTKLDDVLRLRFSSAGTATAPTANPDARYSRPSSLTAPRPRAFRNATRRPNLRVYACALKNVSTGRVMCLHEGKQGRPPYLMSIKGRAN